MRTLWPERLLAVLGEEVAGYERALHRRAGGETFSFEDVVERLVADGVVTTTVAVAVTRLDDALDKAVADYAALRWHRGTLVSDKETSHRWTVQVERMRSLIAEIENDLAEEVRLLGPAVSAPDGTPHLLVETIHLGKRFVDRVEALARIKKPSRKGDKTNRLASMVAQECRSVWRTIAVEQDIPANGGKDLRGVVYQMWLDYELPLGGSDLDDSLKRAFRATA